jgi:hypothetical protein
MKKMIVAFSAIAAFVAAPAFAGDDMAGMCCTSHLPCSLR